MKGRIEIISLVLIFAAFSDLKAESSIDIVRAHILGSVTSVLRGRPEAPSAPQNKFTLGLKRNLSSLELGAIPQEMSLQSVKNSSSCTGIGLEGCILTAAHCVGEKPNGVYLGARIEGPASHQETAKRVLGTSPYEDLAIIRVDPPLSEENSLTRSQLSKAPLEPGAQVKVTGFGFYGTRSTDLSGNLLTGREDWGSGIRRTGSVRLVDYGPLQATPSNEEQNSGRFLWFRRNPHLVASGDSGGPVFTLDSNAQAKLHGVLAQSSFISRGQAGLESKANALKRDLKAEDALEGAAVPVADAYPWIIKTLDDLGCKTKREPH